MKTSHWLTSCVLTLSLSVQAWCGLITDGPAPERKALSLEDLNMPDFEDVPSLHADQMFEQAERESSLQSGEKDILANRKIKQALDAAEAARREGDWERGLSELKKGLMLEPNNLQLIGHAAAFAALARRYEEADQLFQRFLRDQPRNSAFLVGRADVLLRMGRKDEAAEVIEQARLINSNSLSVNFSLLAIEIARGKTPNKAPQWDLIEDAKVLANLVGWIASDRDDLEAVMGPEGFALFCDQVIGPDAATNLNDIRDAATELRDNLLTMDAQGAAKALDRLKQLRIRKPAMEMNVAIEVFESGSTDQALALAKDAIAESPDFAYLSFNEGLMYLRLERYAEAERSLERACRLDPRNGSSAFGLACALAEQGLKYKAWEVLQPLTETHSVQMLTWIEGNQPYLKALQNDTWYEPIRKKIGYRSQSDQDD